MDCCRCDTSPLPEGKSPSPRLCWVEAKESYPSSPLSKPNPGEVTPIIPLGNVIMDDSLTVEDVTPEEAEQVRLPLVAELPTPLPVVASQTVVQDDIVLVDVEKQVLDDFDPSLPIPVKDKSVGQDLTSSEAHLEQDVLAGNVETAIALAVRTQGRLIPAPGVQSAACMTQTLPSVLNSGVQALIAQNSPKTTQRRSYWRRPANANRTARTAVLEQPAPREESSGSGCFPFRLLLRRLFRRKK